MTKDELFKFVTINTQFARASLTDEEINEITEIIFNREDFLSLDETDKNFEGETL